MIYVREPTDIEREEWYRMSRQEVGRVSQRAQMVLLSGRQQTVPQIAMIFEVSRATVRFWLKRFNQGGPAGLYDDERQGRPRKVTPEVKQQLAEWMEDDPGTAGFLATCWTVAMLTLALLKRVGVQVSPSTLRAVLHELGLAWRRPRLRMPDKLDPDKAAKQWAIAKAVITASPETVVVYGDETRLQLLPLLRAMWQWVGEQVRIPTPGTNVTRTILGALNIRSGQWSYLIRPRNTAQDFIAFLEHLLTTYPAVPILLIVDNFSSHKAGVVTAWLQANPRLQVLFLPTYCSHLNPVEPIWLRLKGDLAANRLYQSMTLLLEITRQFFAAMSPAQALIWAGSES
jgi:transposase